MTGSEQGGDDSARRASQQLQQIDPGRTGPYGGDDVRGKLVESRFRAQTWMGIAIAGSILAVLIVSVGLIAYLAIDRRGAAYIQSVAQALQPFVLPTLGIVVGYALGTTKHGPNE